MKKFKVKMRRTYETTTEVMVVANNKDEAYDIVYNNLGDEDIYRLETEDLWEAEMHDEIFEIEEVLEDVSLSSMKVIKELEGLIWEYNQLPLPNRTIIIEGVQASIYAIKNAIESGKLNEE